MPELSIVIGRQRYTVSELLGETTEDGTRIISQARILWTSSPERSENATVRAERHFNPEHSTRDGLSCSCSRFKLDRSCAHVRALRHYDLIQPIAGAIACRALCAV